MKQLQDKSPLLSLPRELRDAIYIHAFTTNVNIAKKDPRSRNLGLLLTCRQIRNEAFNLYYQRTTFEMSVEFRKDKIHLDPCLHFLKSLPSDDRDLITNFHLSYEMSKRKKMESQAPWRLRNREARLERIEKNRSQMQRDLSSVHGMLKKKRVDLDKGVLKFQVMSWDGEENVGVWTSTPRKVPLPHIV